MFRVKTDPVSRKPLSAVTANGIIVDFVDKFSYQSSVQGTSSRCRPVDILRRYNFLSHEFAHKSGYRKG